VWSGGENRGGLSSSHPKKQTNKKKNKTKQKKKDEEKKEGREGGGERGGVGGVDHPAIINILQTSSFLNAFKFYFVLRFEKLINAMKMKCDENYQTMSRNFSKRKRRNT
jgi:hypothetical protein